MDIHPEKLVDLDEITQDFLRILRETHRQDSPRIIVASDDSGRGKSSLLRRLHHVGLWSEELPAALIALDEIEERNQFGLIELVVEQLNSHPAVSFGAFDRLNRARQLRQADPLVQLLADMARSSGAVHMTGAEFKGGEQTIGGIAAKSIERIENLTVEMHGQAGWSAGHEAEARKACIAAFFNDLPRCCPGKPFVVLIDSVDDKAPDVLREWVLLEFIRNGLIQSVGRECPWVLVVAGRPLLRDAIQNRFLDRYSDWISFVPEALQHWTTDHVSEFVQRHVGSPVLDHHLPFLETIIKHDRCPLDTAIAVARLLDKGA